MKYSINACVHIARTKNSFLVLIFAFALFSCSQDDGTYTETVCFGDGNCFGKSAEEVDSDCFDH